ncbi:MAG: 16S rRNA (cytosine(967)-C(5))-methyltransferase RsmB [Clostridia bacterium]|nr:16S rRNA (cytosine(967)-C(5))-methyltransferase RsmB [Clostridia bacterium]
MTDARQTAFHALSKMERDNAYSNLLLPEIAAAEDLSRRDMLLAYRIVKTVLERKITIDYNLSLYLTQPLKKLKPQVLTILRMGTGQLLFMDKIPPSAAINESVKLSKKNGCAFASGLINAVLRKISTNGLSLPEDGDSIKFLSIKYSFPEYICEKFISYFGFETAEKIMASSLGDGNIYIRKNTLKDGNFTFEFEKTDFPENCYVIKNTGDIAQLTEFKNGLFHVQDLSSQLCCRVLSPEKGETVIDVCSAPGGKTMTMAQMMGNDGRIISCDIHEHKLKLINDTAKRLGIDIVETHLRDGADKNAVLPEADKILCDVPCSGFGVTGKKPEIKYKNQEEIALLPDLQLEILLNSAQYLKKGGKLVYSTCTLLPEENIEVCRKFLKEKTNFRAVHIDDEIKGKRDGEAITVLPYDYDCDGFFIAAFERTE